MIALSMPNEPAPGLLKLVACGLAETFHAGILTLPGVISSN